MDLGLRGQAVLVAASSRGIGRATARIFAEEGARVAICSRDAAVLQRTADEIREATGAEVLAVPTNVANADEVARLIDRVVEAFGALNVLVCNAGGPPPGVFDDFGDDAWQAAFDLNFMSTVRMIRGALPHMRRQGGGRIIAIMSSSVKQPIDGLILSNGIRTGVIGLTKTLSQELGKDRITVNVVCPGRILTDRLRSSRVREAERRGVDLDEVLNESRQDIPLGDFGAPEDVGNMIVYLASRQARYVSGQTIVVDGGLVRALHG